MANLLLRDYEKEDTPPLEKASSRLLKNAHLPFDRPFDTLRVPRNVEGLMALSNVEGRRCPHPLLFNGKD
jgi:hypothetical protein